MSWRMASLNRSWGRGPFQVLLALGLLLRATSYVAAAEDVERKVAEALDSIRGVELSKLSADERDALGKRLDEAWKTVLDNPKQSKPLVRAALEQERQDSFRIIDLAHLLLALDSDLMVEAAAALARADPNGYPDGYFEVASGMAAMDCKPCLPAVLKLLELKQLDTSIPEHALPVNLELGVIFTIGQYGDAALDGVLSGLKSENCIVRGNAALAAGQLLPVIEPALLSKIALGDSCEESRRRAWVTLGELDSPTLAKLAGKRLAAENPPSIEERKAIVSGLSLAFSRAVLEPLRVLSADSDPEVAKAAKEGLEGIEKHAPTRAELRTKVGSGSPSFRKKVQRLLQKAKQEGRFEFEGRRLELLTALTPGDLSLLNEARAAVLNRVSDECLYEYFDLSYVARALRTMSGTGESEVDTDPLSGPPKSDDAHRPGDRRPAPRLEK